MSIDNTPGKIFVISAASGTGKTSLVKVLVESLDDITTSVSHTTRPMRRGERNKEHYFFVTESDFEKMIAQQEFLEYAKVFGNYYGTSKKWVEHKLAQGIDVILEIDWQGAKQVKKLMPSCFSIFILPPSLAELKRRLSNRNQDAKDVIIKRLNEAHREISHAKEFDYIVVNDIFEVALVDLRSIIRANRLINDVQLIRQKKLLLDLTNTK